MSQRAQEAWGWLVIAVIFFLWLSVALEARWRARRLRESIPTPKAAPTCKEAGLCDSRVCINEPGLCDGCYLPAKCPCADSPTACHQ